LRKRSTHLDNLTSPASDASAMLSQAASNLGSTLVKLKDARDKFETVRDCEPAIDRLRVGVKDMEERRLKTSKSRKNRDAGLSEQDVYAAADSMEILRDAFDYFLDRKAWRSTPSALQQLERVHKQGVGSMCTLITSHLLTAGQSIQLKRSTGKKEGPLIPAKGEGAQAVSTDKNCRLHVCMLCLTNFFVFHRPILDSRAPHSGTAKPRLAQVHWRIRRAATS
jgi:hypothetical protein